MAYFNGTKGYPRSAQKPRVENALAEYTSNATLKAKVLSNLGLAGAAVGADYATTPTAAGTTTLLAASPREQFFTGTTTQTVVLPVASTGIVGQDFLFTNASTGAVTVQSSGLNNVVVVAPGTSADVTLVTASGTGASSWNAEYRGEVISSAKLLTVTNTLTLSGTDGTTMTFPSTSATIARTDAANTFTGVQTMTSPVLTTPSLGVATATSVNKMAITAPATSSTLAVADGKTLTASNSLTLAGTDSTVMTFPSTSATIARTDAANTFAGLQTIPTLAITGTTAGAVNLGDNAVTQGTSNSTTVVSNTPSGVITSFGAYSTAGATAATAFTVTCSACAATSAVLARIVSYSGTLATNGFPHACVSSIAGGSFVITVVNLHAANALSGTIKFAYAVL